MKQKLLQMFQVTVPIFFYFYEIWKIKELGSFNMHFFTCIFCIIILQKMHEKRPYLLHFLDFIKIKKNWNSNLKHFQQLLFIPFLEILKIKKKYTGFFIKCDFSKNTFFPDFQTMLNVLVFAHLLVYVAALAIWIWPKSGEIGSEII